MLSLGVGLTSVPVLARRGPTYHPAAVAFFARLTNQPTDARKKLYSDLFTALDNAGVLTKLDALYILAAADAQAARQNVIANAYNLTASGSPSFTADRGYTGDGVGAYLATGFVPSTAGGKYALNSAHLGVWSATDATGLGNELSARTASGNKQSVLQVRSTLNIMNSRLNQDAAGTGPTVTGGLGHFVVSRTGSATVNRYRNAVTLAADTTASSALTEFGLTILAQNEAGVINSFSSRQLSVAHLGAALTGADVTALNTALNTYLTAVGAT